MPRPIWTGSISFGLVSIPVKLYPATSSHRIRFHQLQRGNRRADPPSACGREHRGGGAYDDIVKGYEAAPGPWALIRVGARGSLES